MSAAPWWETFFDVDYATAWEAAGAFANTEAEVEALVSFAGLEPGLRVLDLPCGFGRHAGPLAARGLEVVGADISADQLALAAERNPGPTYVRADLREPPDGPFDVLLNLFTSIGYFTDPSQDRRALRAWREVLRPGGLVVIETNHRDRIAKIFEPRTELGGGVVEERVVDWVAGVSNSKVTLPHGSTRRFQVLLYTATELVGMLLDAGFVDVEAYGGLDEAPLSPDTRLAVRARRPGEP